MKKLIVNPKEKEKILEQYSGTLKVDTKKFNRLLESKLGDVRPIVEGLPETTPTPTQQIQLPQTTPTKEDLEKQRNELILKMQEIETLLGAAKKKEETTEKEKTLAQVQERLVEVENYLKTSCKKFFKGKLCRNYFKEQEKLSEDLRKIQGLSNEISGGSGNEYRSSNSNNELGNAPQKITAWTLAIGGLSSLIFSLVSGINKDDSQ